MSNQIICSTSRISSLKNLQRLTLFKEVENDTGSPGQSACLNTSQIHCPVFTSCSYVEDERCIRCEPGQRI